MATVEEHPATNGTATAAGDIAVENPATGEVIAHVPETTPEQVAELARASRAARGSYAARRSGSSTTQSASSRRSSPRRARPMRTRSSPR